MSGWADIREAMDACGEQAFEHAKRDAAEAAAAPLRAEVDRLRGDLDRANLQAAQSAAELAAARAELATKDAALAAAVKRLEDHMAQPHYPPPATQHRVAYGSNPFGWVRKGESQDAAWARITAAAGFGPQKTVRLWPQGDVSSLSWAQVFPDRYRTAKRAVINLGSGKAHVDAYASGARNAALERLCASKPAGFDIIFTVGHEPENDGIDVAMWGRCQSVVGAIAKRHSIGLAPLLMGTTYDPKRVSWSGNILWDRWWAGIDLDLVTHVGADCYQMGKTAAAIDTAEVALLPPLEAAKTLGLPLIVGELGARKVEILPDAGRAKFLTDAVRICDSAETSHGVKVSDVHYFETDNGAADRVPWCLIDNSSPQAVAVWRAACSRS